MPEPNASDDSFSGCLGDAGCLGAGAMGLAWSPAPSVAVSAGGRVLFANAAAVALAGLAPAGIGSPLTEALGLEAGAGDVARALAAAEGEAEWPARTGLLGLRWRRVGPDLVVVVLEPRTALAQARRDADRVAALLEVAQDFGRLGVWERDVRTLRGRWDRHVYRFWGLDPDKTSTPDFAAAAESIVESDRIELDAVFRNSLRRAGTYAHRYRVRAADGSVRHLHSQWTVRNGPDGRPESVLGVMMDDTQTWDLARAHAAMASQLSMAVDLARIGLWHHDIATGRVELSAQGREILGITAEDGRVTIDDLRALIHPEDVPRVLAEVQRSLHSDRPVDIEARHRLPDGGWHHVLTRRAVQRDAQGRPVAFLGLMIDTSERAEQNKRAAELARRFELATRTAGIGYWTLEGGAERATWSDELRAIHGLAPDAPVPSLDEWLARFVHPDDRVWVRQRYANWVSSGAASLEADLRLVRPDGQVREVQTHQTVESAGRAPWLFGVVIDVTERRSAELALRQAAERARLAARAVGLGTWELDVRTGEASWDDRMWTLRGLTPRPGWPGREATLAMVHPDDREAMTRAFAEASGGEGIVNQEFRVVLPDGSVRWLASRSTPVRDARGELARRIGVNWDITDRRLAEAERQERELAQRENQAKSRFLSRMSHELRTPLNAVLGFTQLLLAEPAGTEPVAQERRRRLQYIEDAGEHLLSLINDVLDLSSLESGEMRIDTSPVALADIVDQAVPLVAPLISARGVSLHRGALDAVVVADAVRLRQVLINLLSNAAKYNRQGGDIFLEAARMGSEVRLAVRDTGRGMTAEQRAHLFEPFNRLGIEREGIEGTGVGLVIVRTVVERMGGRVLVESEPGAGSTFTVVLPAAERPPAAATTRGREPVKAVAGAVARPAAAERRVVLYIEDNPVNATIVREVLTRHGGIDLTVADNGLGGLEQARRLLPDLVLLDMHLPDIDGHEVRRRMAADPALAGIPCIALSASAMPEEVARARAAGVVDYLTKPLDLPQFLARLDLALGRRT